MNYEESPIIAFNLLADQTLAFESCWKMTNDSPALSIDEVKAAFNQFVTQIRKEVEARS